MSATEIIAEIEKLPAKERAKVTAFVRSLEIIGEAVAGVLQFEVHLAVDGVALLGAVHAQEHERALALD